LETLLGFLVRITLACGLLGLSAETTSAPPPFPAQHLNREPKSTPSKSCVFLFEMSLSGHWVLQTCTYFLLFSGFDIKAALNLGIFQSPALAGWSFSILR
jgi:hypothetical protein